jgi:4-hydroxybutyryl-CoA dehydratase/vinylacetyl-CoA-Delta-isomerase
MLTGSQYKRSLYDGRATYFEGNRIDDIPGHPILGQSADIVARGYDRWYSPESGARNPLMSIPHSAEELRARIGQQHGADILTLVTYQSIMTLTTAGARIGATLPKYAERIRNYVEQAQRDDLRVTECITDAKGNRSLPPAKQDDPDAYTHLVERRADGVVIRGAKLHITAASLGHDLLVIPTKAMHAGEEAYAIACMVPVNAPGVKIINTTYAPRHADVREFPFSAKNHMPEGFVILDDVFVPNERVFLDGETAQAAVFAHSLGLWERLGGLSDLAETADQLVGFAQLIAEANGLARESHVREKISEMLIHATLIRATLEAAISNCEVTADGTAFPNELYTNAGKYHGAANYSLMVRHLHDIGGGSILTAPAVADLESEATGPLLRKYMSTMKDVDGGYRLRLFHAIRDLTADSFGGWRAVTNVQAGGGLYAQRIVTRRHYDLEGAKKKALAAAGLLEEKGS